MYTINRQDPIIAIATPPGTGAIAVIRLSGTGCIGIVSPLFKSRKKKQNFLEQSDSHSLYFGVIEEDGILLDEILLSVFKGPHSYTGDDTIEISCHGSPYIQQQIVSLFLKRGVRLAQPGEFTLRAFLNGKMDLSQAEAVADLIASDSSFSHHAALQQMRGGFSGEIKKLREELIHFASLLELELDFAEEDVEFASRTDLMNTVHRLLKTIRSLIDSFELGNVIRTGIPVVIAGKPNVGKSTLLNAFLNEERAIVSEIAGTTRDTIEEDIVLGGIKIRFIDTAGIRETTDTIERIGVQKTYEKIKESPIILYLFDINETGVADLKFELDELRQHLAPEFRLIPVANKIDGHDPETVVHDYISVPGIVFISAKEKRNVHALAAYLREQFHTGTMQITNTTVTNLRHADALRKTAGALEHVLEGLSRKVTSDFIAGDLRIALHYLGEITGQISSDDLLENIFSKFCIGK
ncbi:MAG TPA: tRNA uridine-5-carboxymethylaminomethyl(34) synthesis GTPase MnmE [Bacteroidia bacterium]|nr:tRNA uridine-5-carboxymethylaminomethyl(34) synthesis GTPase MnmE [Bacteroidia bacterium]